VTRRLLWLAAGAVLGIAGYRRLDRAAKSMTWQAALVRHPALVRRRPRPGLRTFAADVRAGMAEYLDRHQAGDPSYLLRQHAGSGNTLLDQTRMDQRARSRATADETKDGR
jgi:hypothetical protein